VKPIIGHYSLTSITQALRINSDQIKQHVQPDDDIRFFDVSDSLTPFFSKHTPDSRPASFDQNKVLTISIEMRRATGEVLNINALPMSSLCAGLTSTTEYIMVPLMLSVTDAILRVDTFG